MAHDGPPDDETRRLAQEAMAKRRARRKPTREETAALKRMQRYQDEQSRERHYREIPKKDWVRMSGRQHKILDEQARRYGIPIDGKSIDLYRIANWLHGFIAENGRKLSAAESEEDLLYGGDGTSPALEKLRMESYRLKRLDRLERENQLIPREKIHTAMVLFASTIKSLGDDLQHRFGPDALEMLNDRIADAERVIEQTLRDGKLPIDEEDEDDDE